MLELRAPDLHGLHGFTAVGIKCPECAGQPTGVRRRDERARTAAGDSTGLIVTKTLIAVNVAVFLLEIAQGGATSAVRARPSNVARSTGPRLPTASGTG